MLSEANRRYRDESVSFSGLKMKRVNLGKFCVCRSGSFWSTIKNSYFTYHGDYDFESADNIPLYVLMEGRSWGLTSLLITTVALWMVAFDHGETDTVKYLDDIEVGKDWTSDLAEYAIFSILGICAVVVSVGTLQLNMKPPSVKRMRLQIFASSFCLLAVNAVSIYQGIWSIRRCVNNEAQWTSKPAHFFITGCAVLFTFMADILFVQYFGCCMFWWCCELPTTQSPKANPDLENELLPDDERSDEHQLDQEPEFMTMAAAPTQEFDPVEEEEHATETTQVEQLEEEIQVDGEGDEANSVVRVSRNLVTSQASSQSSTYNPRSLETWNTRRVLRNYEQTSYSLRAKAISESQEGEGDYAPPDSYHGEPTAEASMTASRQEAGPGNDRPRPEDLMWFICNMRNPRRWLFSVVNAVTEEVGTFSYSVWVKASCLTTFIVVIYICILTVHQTYRICKNWGSGIGCLETNEEVLRQFVNDLGCMRKSDRSFLFNLLDYIDTVTPRLKYTVCFGYPLGCFFALHSVYSVMVQYKRLTKALDHEVLVRENLVRPSGKSNIVKDLWPELEERYPIGGAVYFLGILCSTAVLQLQVFGFMISVFLAVLVNYEQYGYLMKFVGFYMLIYLIIFVIDWLFLHILPNRVLSTGLRIKRPRVFFVYMFVFSIVHLVLGFLYAIWRFFHLTLTTFLLINRLDITLSKEFRGWDSGHKAFMSLLVLTNIVQRDKFKKKKRRPLKRVRTAVKRVIKTLHGANPARKTPAQEINPHTTDQAHPHPPPLPPSQEQDLTIVENE